jgi:hypothetical protein
MTPSSGHVRFTPDKRTSIGAVGRFVPIGDIRAAAGNRRYSITSSALAWSRQWHCKAKRFGGLEIDDQPELERPSETTNRKRWRLATCG